MKALTLTQPWATLVAIGAKRVETRSWRLIGPNSGSRTPLNMPLAIHAAKGFPTWARELCFEEPFSSVLREHLPAGRYLAPADQVAEIVASLPLGAVVATAVLLECCTLVRLARILTPTERAFGDYSPGRYGWLLGDVRPLPTPVPARGALGLWEWTPPPGLNPLAAVDGGAR